MKRNKGGESREVTYVDIKANETKKRGAPKTIAISCDVTSAAQVKDAVDKTINELGGIDILVNNVGGGLPLTPQN